MQQNGTEVANAYRCCWRIATSHYENFTVGSWLLPRRLRRHIAAIYAFARTADDMADEGHAPATERLAKLREHEAALDACYRGTATTPIFIALADTVSRFEIPSAPFRRLLAAFRTDVEFKPFADFDALREYCRCSADPVGHLVLYLFGYRDAQRQALADNICTGLQLANFWQDVRVDGAKGRVYVPRTDLERFGCTADDLLNGRDSEATRALISFEVDRARSLLCAGLPLVDLVDRRLGREVRLFAEGGLTILDLIEAQRFDVFTARPVVSKAMKARMVLRAFGGLPRPSHNPVIAPPIESGRDASVPAVAHSSEARLHSDYEYCQEITRRSSSNFYYAFQLLSPERRSALYAVYAFCRFVDDVADDEGRREPEKLLERWREELVAVYAGTPGHAISRALADSVRRFPLDQRHFLDLIQGVETDLTRRRYDTFDDLYRYCYLVASTVGLLCIEIFGYRNPSARAYAVDLGIAFQLTNILRDVVEDGRRGRIYLPLEDLRRFDCTEDELLRGHYSPRLGALLAFECGRARAYYLRASGALDPEDRGTLAAADAMRMIYERLLDRIEARHFDVFASRVTLSSYEKVKLALSAWGRSQLALRHS